MRHDEYRGFDGLGLAHLVRSRQVTAAELLDLALQRTAATDEQIAAVVYLQADRGAPGHRRRAARWCRSPGFRS